MPKSARVTTEIRKKERQRIADIKKKEEDTNMAKICKGERSTRERRMRRAEMRVDEEIGSRKLLETRVRRLHNIHYQRLILKRKYDVLRSFRCKVCKGRAFSSFERYHHHISTHKRWTHRATPLKYRFNKAPEVIVMKLVKNLKTIRKSTRVLRKFGEKDSEYFFKPSSDGKFDIHFESVNFKCAKCSDIFDSAKAFQKHAIDAHPGVYLHLCSHCGGIFEDETLLRIHERKHAENSLKCTQCVNVFSSVAKLEQHVRTFHNIGPYECHYCSRTFKTKNMRNGHLVAHRRAKTKQTEDVDQEILERCKNEKCHDISIQQSTLKQGHKKQTEESMSYQEKQLFKCSKCDEQFENKILLEAHIIFHNGDNMQYECPPCEKSFSDLGRLITHALKSKSHNDPEKCFQCGKTLKSRKMIKQHLMMIHYNSQIFKCQLCSMNFLNMQAVKMHMASCRQEFLERCKSENCHEISLQETTSEQGYKKQTKELGLSFQEKQVFKCSKCDEQFANKILLESHIIFHNGDNMRYECPPCEKSFTDLGRLITHALKSKSHKDPEKCFQCGKTLKSRKMIKQHLMMIHYNSQIFKCQLCSMNFLNMQAVKMHMASCRQEILETCESEKCHDFSLQEPTLEQGYEKQTKELGMSCQEKQIFKCSKCDEQFENQILLEAHIIFHNGDNVQYECPPCGKSFSDLGRLITHALKSKSHNDPEKCFQCGKTLKSRQMIKQHLMMIHYKSQIFKCQLCSMNFLNMQAVKMHMASYRQPDEKSCIVNVKDEPTPNEKDKIDGLSGMLHNCKHCNRKFKNKVTLKAHEACHESGDKQYDCPSCVKVFPDLEQLQQHVMSDKGHKNPLACPKCDKTFKLRSGVKHHLISHFKGEGFICDICSKSFTRMKSLQCHIDWHKGRFKCKTCGKHASSKHELTVHERTHSAELFTCKTCGRGFKSKKGLLTHANCSSTEGSALKAKVKQQYEEREKRLRGQSVSCSECDKTFKRLYSLKLHKNSAHGGEKRKRFSCNLCDKSFVWKTRLQEHVSYAHSNKEKQLFSCTHCDKSFAMKSSLQRHLDWHEGRFKCKTCGKNCHSQYGLTLHERKHNADPVFTCETCGRGFKHKISLLTHSGCSATEETVLKLKQQREAKGPHICPHCKKSFTRKCYLRVHVLARHTNIRPYKCSFCNKRFVNSSNKKLHERVHNPVHKRAHMCDICGNTFAKKESLADHITMHTGEMAFKCTECDQYFRTKLHRHNHFNRVHLTDNPHVCTICGIVEATASQLQTHMNYHIKPFICQHCGVGFGSMYGIKQHEKTHLKVSDRVITERKRDRRAYYEQRKEKRRMEREEGKSKESKGEKATGNVLIHDESKYGIGEVYNDEKSKEDEYIHIESKYVIDSLKDNESGQRDPSHHHEYVLGAANHDSKATELLEAINQNFKKP